MKTSNMVMVCLVLTILSTQAQVASGQMGASQTTLPAPTPYQVVESGPNHRVWQWQTYEPGPNGQIITDVHHYTELASGLNYLNASGQWVAAQEQIEPFAGGAVARQGQHQVIFANNLNTAGAIDMQTPDGLRLRSNILGLMYSDPSTGQAVIIAQIQDSQGELISANKVLYPKAFDAVNADVQYTYRRDGIEQDVILREQPPAPEAFGMNSATTELEVFTEFINPPSADITDLTAPESGLETDQAVNWGATRLGRGKAFNLGGQDAPAPVAKRYAIINGRYFLLEKVLLRDIKPALSQLPEQASIDRKLPMMASKNPVFPKTPKMKSASRPMRLAMASHPNRGYVLDYVTATTAFTNYTFQSDTTYYVSGTLTLYGTNTFEGGTAIKYAANSSIITSSPIVFNNGAYRPVVFTAKDDNTVGDPISGSTGSPSGYYANPALNLLSSSQSLSGFRVAYAANAVESYSGPITISDAQFVKCGFGVYVVVIGNINVNNALFSNVKTNLYAFGAAANNVTFNNSFCLGTAPALFNISLQMTNCILANVTNITGTVSAGNNGFYNAQEVGASPTTNTVYPFQQVGAASCYLTNGCSFIGTGTSTVNPSDLALLLTRTTRPPIVFSNLTISYATNFGPQAYRDTNAADLGYHYDSLDYIFGNVTVQSNFVFGVGTAVGWFEANSGMTGISLKTGGSLTFQGTATVPCNFARYSSVQEGGNGNWAAKGYLGGVVFNGSSSANPPQITAQFTKWEVMAGGPNQFRDNSTYGGGAFTDNEFYGGNIGSYVSSFYFTNCLVFRVSTAFYAQANAGSCTFQNCDFYNGMLLLCRYSGQSASFWNIENTAFDGTAFVTSDNFNGTNSTLFNFNAYNTNNLSWQTYNSGYSNTGTLEVVGPNDVKGSNYNWQASWFGNFYLPSNSRLIQAGSTNANLLGLYHFTTQTNQVPETNSIVTIGYHYVATDAYGNPLDSNGDGIPDYLEDANGDGIFDAGDLGEWKLSPFGLGGTNALQVFTPLK